MHDAPLTPSDNFISMGLQHSQLYASAGSRPKRFFAAFGITPKDTANSLTAIDGTQARGAIATKTTNLDIKTYS
tara:strand:- start:1164 stop:1385 length:222 start_codon:yes stop_codon:yes gene_type:complete